MAIGGGVDVILTKYLAWRFFEASELELGIASSEIVRIGVECPGIATPKVLEHGAAAGRIVDDDEAPRLT